MREEAHWSQRCNRRNKEWCRELGEMEKLCSAGSKFSLLLFVLIGISSHLIEELSIVLKGKDCKALKY